LQRPGILKGDAIFNQMRSWAEGTGSAVEGEDP